MYHTDDDSDGVTYCNNDKYNKTATRKRKLPFLFPSFGVLLKQSISVFPFFFCAFIKNINLNFYFKSLQVFLRHRYSRGTIENVN